MYALPFVYHISYAGDSLGEKAKKEKAVGHRFVDLFSLRCIRFGVISAGTCVALGYFYYARWVRQPTSPHVMLLAAGRVC